MTDLIRLAMLAKEATPGPWSVDDGWQPPQWNDETYTRVVSGEPNPVSGIRHPVLHTDGSIPGSDRKAQQLIDAEFAALAREAVPVLLKLREDLLAYAHERQRYGASKNSTVGSLRIAADLLHLLGEPWGDEDRPPLAEVVTLCGSSKFKDQINAENARLTREGHLVISLGMFGHTDFPEYDWATDSSDLKIMLDRIHRQKIDMAARIHVVNPGGYIGESTQREIDYAIATGKAVTYLEPKEPVQ